jgi:putative DNA primase/helicase
MCQDVAKKVRNRAFKNNVLGECAELFYDKSFVEKIDEKRSLIGFEDGVFDLESMTFRKSRPQDMISFTTGLRYTPLDKTDDSYKLFDDFMTKVLPDKNTRDYFLMAIASSLDGKCSNQLFHIITGHGGNGKSVAFNLFQDILNDYAVRIPVSLIQHKRGKSNEAQPEVAQTKGRRLGIFDEPEGGSSLNESLVKQYTGGDKIKARPLYHDPIEFKPQNSLFMLCNDIPHIDCSSHAVRRRVVVIEFPCKFVMDDSLLDLPNYFRADPNLTEKFADDHFKSMALSYLIDYYNILQKKT